LNEKVERRLGSGVDLPADEFEVEDGDNEDDEEGCNASKNNALLVHPASREIGQYVVLKP
jgi:hypothetical protein